MPRGRKTKKKRKDSKSVKDVVKNTPGQVKNRNESDAGKSPYPSKVGDPNSGPGGSSGDSFGDKSGEPLAFERLSSTAAERVRTAADRRASTFQDVVTAHLDVLAAKKEELNVAKSYLELLKAKLNDNKNQIEWDIENMQEQLLDLQGLSDPDPVDSPMSDGR